MVSNDNCGNQYLAQQLEPVQYQGQQAQFADGTTVTVRRVVEVDWVASLLLSILVSLALTYLVNSVLRGWFR